MKIHEIIAENKTNEAALGALAGLAKTIGAKGIKAGAKLAAKSFPKVAGKAATYGTTALKVSRVASGALTFLKYLGLASIVHDYYKAVSKGEALVASGEWTEDEFQDFRQGEMTKLVLAIASSTVFFTAIKVFSGFSIWIRLLKLAPSPAIKALAVTLNGLAESVRVAFIAFLVSPKGREAREAIGDLIGRGIIDNTLGGNGVALVDKVKHFLDASQPDGKFKSPMDPTKAGATAEPEADKVDPNKDTPTSASPATAANADSDSDYAYDTSKYTRSPSGALIAKVKPTN